MHAEMPVCNYLGRVGVGSNSISLGIVTPEPLSDQSYSLCSVGNQLRFSCKPDR